MENESYISLGETIILLALFAQRYSAKYTKLFEVQISNVMVRPMYYALWTRPTIWIPNQYIRKQDGVHLSSIQMVVLSGIQIPKVVSEYWT